MLLAILCGLYFVCGQFARASAFCQPGAIVIGRVCLFVCLFVVIVRKVKIRCPASAPTFIINFSEVKVKVQGQNRRRPYWKFSTCNNLAMVYDMFAKFDRSNFGMKNNLRQNSRWRPTWRRFALSSVFFDGSLVTCTIVNK